MNSDLDATIPSDGCFTMEHIEAKRIMIPAGLQSYKIPINPTAIAALFHISGVIGIIWGNADWFISLTPLNLLLMFALLVWTAPELHLRWFFFFILCYGSGFLSEMTGVNTGMLFGSYQYGNALGPKVSGVPLLIAINWFMVVYGAGHIVSMIIEKTGIQVHYIIKVIIAAGLCTIFDWIMEPAAIRLGYWNWLDAEIPIFNYVTWFLLSALLLFTFEKCVFKKHPFAIHLFLIQTLFFLILHFSDPIFQ